MCCDGDGREGMRVVYLCFFNDTATTEIYTLSLHDALPILRGDVFTPDVIDTWVWYKRAHEAEAVRTRPHPYEFTLYFEDRKSTRLNSSHANISYAVFCLKKKNTLTRERCIPASTVLVDLKR